MLDEILEKVRETPIRSLPTLADGNVFDDEPGVFLLWCGVCGESRRRPLYIGKADSLKHRLSQQMDFNYLFGFLSAIAFGLLFDEAFAKFRDPCDHVASLFGTGEIADLAMITRVLAVQVPGDTDPKSVKASIVREFPCYWVTSRPMWLPVDEAKEQKAKYQR